MLRSLQTMVCLIALTLLTASSNAQNFRMETDVLLSGQKKPLVQTLTLFTDSMVYDFIYGPADGRAKDDQQVTEVTVFDMSAGRVILLDIAKARKTVLSHEQLVQMTAAMKVSASANDGVYAFAADPKFDTKFAEDKQQLSCTSASLIYSVKGQKPEQPAAVFRYQEFADWSARLNACRPGNLPPYARMEVGKQLADRGLIPEEITRTMIAPGRLGNKRVELTSRHHVNWAVSTKDRKRIETVAEQIGKFEGVTFLSFVESEKAK